MHRLVASALTLDGTAVLAGEFDLDCRSFANFTSATGCAREAGETLHLREPEPGKLLFYWTETSVFEARLERNGPLVTLWAMGAGSLAESGTSLQTLVLNGGPETLYTTAGQVDGLGFVWSRNQMLCEKVDA